MQSSCRIVRPPQGPIVGSSRAINTSLLPLTGPTLPLATTNVLHFHNFTISGILYKHPSKQRKRNKEHCPLPTGGRRIQVPHFAPIDTDRYAYQGVLVTAGCGWTFWLFARPPRRAPWLGKLGVPHHGAPHDLHCHYKEGPSLLLGGGGSPDFPR